MADLSHRVSILASALSTDAREAAAAARALRYPGILFDAIAPALNLTELSQTGRREFRHVLSSNNLQLAALRFDTGPKGFGPGANVERSLSLLDKTMETAAGLTSPLVCVDLGPLPPAPPAPAAPKPKVTPDMAGLLILPTTAEVQAPPSPPTPQLTEADRAFASQLDVVLADICARADRYSVTLAVRSELASFAALDAVLRRSNCPWLGLDLDPVAVLPDPWPLDEILSRLGTLLRHVRARDAILGDAHRTRPAPIGAGSVNWIELLQSLDQAGYSGWLTVDPTELPDRRAAAFAARDTLLKFRG